MDDTKSYYQLIVIFQCAVVIILKFVTGSLTIQFWLWLVYYLNCPITNCPTSNCLIT